MNLEYKIFINLNSHNLYAASVWINQETLELFIHYPWGSRVEAGVISNNSTTVQTGYLPDHVSFHKDGKGHTKSRVGKKKSLHHSKFDPKINVLSLERNTYLPFFIESINASKDYMVNRRFKKDVTFKENHDILLDAKCSNSFSLILMTKCEKMNPSYIFDRDLKKLALLDAVITLGVCSASQKAIHFTNNSGFNTDLVVLLIQDVIEPFKMISNSNEDEVFTEFSNSACMPSIDLILGSVNQNVL